MKLRKTDVDYLAKKVSENLEGDLHVKVVASTAPKGRYTKSVKYFVELHDKNGRCCDLSLAAHLPAAMDYLDAMRSTLRIVNHWENKL